ncbi:hypothetical protein D9613_001077 [Agrocybe pediades]|uniref:Uncharacterized protein n=1 Tax=Agrocybe pediades TaxID=84607 RepID=A0A8H4VSJ7_9AGAR|nr:hypothetical protein D9613_001077 [Agrocybe pediades]
MDGYLSDVLGPENANSLHEENSLAFLTVMIVNRNLESIVPKMAHFHKLQLRILASVVSFPVKLGQNFLFMLQFDYPLHTGWERIIFQVQGFSTCTSKSPLVSNLHAHHISSAFIHGSLLRLKHADEAEIEPSVVVDTLVALVPLFTDPLAEYMNDQSTLPIRPDLLFAAGMTFLQYFESETFRSWVARPVDSVLSDLTVALDQYEGYLDIWEEINGQTRMTYVKDESQGHNDRLSSGDGDRA